MASTNQAIATLTGAGGTAPYTFSIVADANTTIPATLTGATLTVDATTKEPGTYTVHVQIIDALGDGADRILDVQVLDPTLFAIYDPNLVFGAQNLPFTDSVILQSTGGSGTVTWSLISSVTTLPDAAVTTGGNLSFTLSEFGSWTLGLRAVDSLGNMVSKVVEVTLNTATAYSLVDGQIEIDLNVPTTLTGTHNLTIGVLDSASTALSQTFTYAAAQEVSAIEPIEAAIDHFWGAGDTASVVYPINGDLTGFTLGVSNALLADNGLTATVDPVNRVIEVTGPPTNFGNAELDIPIAIYRGTTQVALVTRTFTLLSHGSPTDIGAFTCTTKPYLVGEQVGLNPKRPFFNSPEVFTNASYTSRVQVGSQLPTGLSLDAVTGLIYGTILDNEVSTSVIEYIDSLNTVHGTITIQWDIQPSAFTLVDALTIGQIQTAYSALMTGSSAVTLTSVALYRGRLPSGLAAAVDSTGYNLQITGTPTEAGYFDVWFRVTNASGQTALLYKRFAVAYISPLVILTDALAYLSTGQAYSQLMTAFGGVQPYTWAILAGVLPAGITLNATSGEISGTTAVTAYAQSITFQVTDIRGVSATTTLLLQLIEQLEITTTVLPIVTSGSSYNYALTAQGGTSPYGWSLGPGSASLPSGISLGSNGVLSGVTTQGAYAQDILFEVTDATNLAATKTLHLAVSTSSGLTIDTSGIGPIIKGASYQGLVKVSGVGAGPYTWSIASDTANPLPSGLTFTGDQSTFGQTATLAGLVVTTLTNYSVKVQVVDANGNSATGYMLLNTISSLKITTANPLPQAFVGSAYSVQLTATGVNTPFMWTLASGSTALPAGLSLSSAGVLYGTPTVLFSGALTIQVIDALGDSVSASLTLNVRSTTLVITTVSLPAAISGAAYNQALAATGGVPAYTWSVSPTSASQLPSGLSLAAATGVISGTSTATGFSGSVTFRLADTTGAYVEKTLLVTVVAALALQTGVDYTRGLSTGLLGYCSGGDVTSISPRPSGSFLVVATGVVATSSLNFKATLPAGYSVQQYTFAGNGIVYLQLSGPFANGTSGQNSFYLTVTDSGVSVAATFKWIVTTDSTLRLAAASGAIPVQYLG